jgi:hypothetical protein
MTILKPTSPRKVKEICLEMERVYDTTYRSLGAERRDGGHDEIAKQMVRWLQLSVDACHEWYGHVAPGEKS